MKSVLVLYATREGHTRHIAERVASDVRAYGLSARIEDARELPPEFDLGAFDMFVLLASVHAGEHEREMIRFVSQHRAALEKVPSAFISVSLTQATAELTATTAEARAQAAGVAEGMIAKFAAETHWQPASVKPVAGALLYTRYNPLVRFVMKRIAARSGGSTDTSQDHEYTNWTDLDGFVGRFVNGAAGVPSH